MNRSGMTPEAHARVRKTIFMLGLVADGWKARAEKAEKELAKLKAQKGSKR